MPHPSGPSSSNGASLGTFTAFASVHSAQVAKENCTSEGVEPADFLYASIQSEAISRWAVLRCSWPAHTSLWSFLSSASLTHGFQGEVLVDLGPKVTIELDLPNASGIR